MGVKTGSTNNTTSRKILSIIGQNAYLKNHVDTDMRFSKWHDRIFLKNN